MTEVAGPEAPIGPPPELAAARLGPPSRRGGPLALVVFMARHGMFRPGYLRLLLGLVRRRFLSRSGRRLELDGIAFVAPRARVQIGPRARVTLGRWSWVGQGTKIRCHEGRIEIGAKTVLGEDVTLSAFQRITIGRECVVADRVMLIDFDHHTGDVERPIRVQGIDKRDVRVGHNVWIGHGASVLAGVTVGDNAVIGAGAVVTRDVPANAVVGGVPARVLRMRAAPRTLRWG